ncbi:MAG: cell surface protein, partial [Planctomycetota bacterium]|nr:cell surface protein [Planctomycetota bacterium]
MRITTLMACAIPGLLASQAQAEEHFVFHPDSIQAAIAGAQSGDRILVGPGTYGEVLDLAGKQLEVVASAGPLQTTI